MKGYYSGNAQNATSTRVSGHASAYSDKHPDCLCVSMPTAVNMAHSSLVFLRTERAVETCFGCNGGLRLLLRM